MSFPMKIAFNDFCTMLLISTYRYENLVRQTKLYYQLLYTSI